MSALDSNWIGFAGRQSWPGSIVFLGILLIACLVSIDRDLWTPDEPREAGISREMWISPGVVPSLNGRPFIEKPPLYYWTVAGVFQLAGGPSPAAARSVSAVASFLTLVLVYFWGRRDFSEATGLLAALGLATSTQFLVSSHWVLIDPLLMLFMTIVCWAGWELISRGGIRSAVIFYIAIVLALWTKGLVGPVLFAAGILVYLIGKRSFRPVLAFYPLAGIVVVALATGLFAYLVYQNAGYQVVREWFWVNHVLRFTAPQTGHEGPFYYYLGAIVVAVMPWWVPFVDIFRPRRWRSTALPNLELRFYLASICLGMTLILSASTTKREIYLLPMLPPLALLIATHAAGWLGKTGREPTRSWPWWVQLALLAGFVAAPVAGVMIYLREIDYVGLGILVLLALIVAAVVILSHLQRRRAALIAFGAVALLSVVGLQIVVVQLAAPHKGMSPFIEWIDTQIPADQAVYGTGNIDETFNGIVPFVTGRQVVRLTATEVRQLWPDYIVVQDKNGGDGAPQLPQRYVMQGERDFAGRYLALWRKSSP